MDSLIINIYNIKFQLQKVGVFKFSSDPLFQCLEYMKFQRKYILFMLYNKET